MALSCSQPSDEGSDWYLRGTVCSEAGCASNDPGVASLPLDLEGSSDLHTSVCEADRDSVSGGRRPLGLDTCLYRNPKMLDLESTWRRCIQLLQAPGFEPL